MAALTLDEIDKRVEHLAAHEAAQEHVRGRFGLPGRDPEALRRIAQCYNPPAWAAGCISLHDAMFLYDAVRGLRPRLMIELGVASGASSVVLLRALADAAAGELHSFELHPFCYFAREKPVGFLVREQAPELESLWRLHVRGTAREAGEWLSGEQVALAFIDADHRHPAPIADLLWLLPALADGAWVVLHDIDLPRLAEDEEKRTGKKVTWHERGAKELFDGWPFEKIRGGTIEGAVGATNIGAIRVPVCISARDLRHIIERPWEVEPGESMRSVLGV